LFNKFLQFHTQEVSFVAKMNELQQDNIRLAREISNWEDGAALDSEWRRTAEYEVSQLKTTIQQLQMDNKKLEYHISEWKRIAEESESNAVKYYSGMNKIFTTLEEVKLELPCTRTEEYYR